jgi:nucleoside-diphosphate-sugar epimerase
MAEQKTVAVAGGTGTLGSLIVEALLANPNVHVRLLVRPESRSGASIFEQRGARIAEGHIGPGSERALDAFCEGAFAVISAVQGGPDVIIDGQRRVLKAARTNGVHRFIPSDFGVDMFRLDEGDNINADWRRQFAEIAAGEGGNIRIVHVLNGCFLDRRILFGFLGAIDLNGKAAYLWGDGNQPMDFTTMEDTARYAAEVTVDEADPPGVFSVAGDVLTFHELVRAYETASGSRLRVEQQGSLADLSARIAQRMKDAPENMMAYLPLMYYRAMLSGKGKLQELMNGRYPNVRCTTVQEYVVRERL